MCQHPSHEGGYSHIRLHPRFNSLFEPPAISANYEEKRIYRKKKEEQDKKDYTLLLYLYGGKTVGGMEQISNFLVGAF